MAIAFANAGAAAVGTTSVAVPHPTTPAAGDMLVLVISNKYPTNGPSTPSGWTAPASNQQSGSSGSNGIDTGAAYCTVFTKIATGSESGNLTVAITSGNCAVGRMFRYTKAAAKNWEVACANGSDNTAGTTWSVTMGANPGVTGSDFIVVGSGINADTYSYSAQAITQTGVTYGTATERQDSGTTGGQDCHLVVSDHAVTSGTGSAAPVYTMTASSSATNAPAGASVFVRLREVDLNVDPGGIASAEAFGTAQIDTATTVDNVGNVASAEAFGAAQVDHNIFAAGIASLESFGTAVLGLEIVASGISSLEVFGNAIVTFPGGDLEIIRNATRRHWRGLFRRRNR